jgi:pilus assembly protein CpaD
MLHSSSPIPSFRLSSLLAGAVRVGAIAGVLSIAGCAHNHSDTSDRPAAPVAVKQLHLALSASPWTLHFSPASSSLSGNETRRLAAYVAGAKSGNDGQVFVVFPADNSSPAAAPAPAIVAMRQASILRALLPMGVTARPGLKIVSENASPMSAPIGPPNDVVVEIGRVTVSVQGCPDWTMPDASNTNNVPTSNFGCADLTNFSLMVANPADLAGGAPAGPADGTFAVRGVERYRAGTLFKSLADSGGGSSGSGSSSSSSGSSGSSSLGGGTGSSGGSSGGGGT